MTVPLRSTGQGAQPEPEASVTLSALEWRTLAAVQSHLLPDEPGAPGAHACRATHYLDRAISEPGFDPAVRVFLLGGVAQLDGICREKHGKSFSDLEPERREALLRALARVKPSGEDWLATLLLYTLEASLGDPIYGGNPDGIGWRWLRHDPGTPRPRAAERRELPR